MEPSCITANYVARESSYSMRPFNWGQADKATQDAFHGPNWANKWDEMAGIVAGMGFKAIDIWVAHCVPTRVSPGMIDEMLAILKQHDLKVVAYTGGLGKPDMTRPEAEQVYKVAKAIGTPLIDVGLHPTNARLAYELGKEYGIKYAIENHPEKTPQEVLARIGDYGEVIGIAQDTGFWAHFDYDPVKATYELKDHLFHMHLKQEKRTPDGWTCSAYDDGVLDIKGVVGALKAIGYDGAVSIETETMYHDPTEEVAHSLVLLEEWLK
jgi:sugar phosphate isomerase/epimerase